LLHDRRRELHTRIVEAIETLYPDRLSDESERLAHHAVRGELREKAVGYLRQAGLRTAARSAPHDARSWFNQALAVPGAIPENQSTLERAFGSRPGVRRALKHRGEGNRILGRLGGAGPLRQGVHAARRRGRIYAVLANSKAQAGVLYEALVSGIR